MKTIQYLWLWISLLPLPSLAQVHLKGQRFIDVQAGLTDGFTLTNHQLGINALLSTGRYNRQYNAWRGTVSYVRKPITLGNTDQPTAVEQFTIGWGYEFNLWRNAVRTRFVRGIIQPIALYESIRPPQSIASDSARTVYVATSRFLLGAEAGIEVELSPIIVSVRQRWLPKSSVQPFHTLFSVGWRFHR